MHCCTYKWRNSANISSSPGRRCTREIASQSWRGGKSSASNGVTMFPCPKGSHAEMGFDTCVSSIDRHCTGIWGGNVNRILSDGSYNVSKPGQKLWTTDKIKWISHDSSDNCSHRHTWFFSFPNQHYSFNTTPKMIFFHKTFMIKHFDINKSLP